MIGGAPSALSVRNCSAGARIGESCVDRKAKNLWTADGVYSTRSAYLIQFRGSHRKFKHELIWKVQAENKCKLHAWILMHNKVLTACKKGDGLIKNIVFCVMDLWRQGFISLCFAPLQRPFGAKCYLGKISWCSCRSRTMPALPNGGKMQQARSQNMNTDISMEY